MNSHSPVQLLIPWKGQLGLGPRGGPTRWEEGVRSKQPPLPQGTEATRGQLNQAELLGLQCHPCLGTSLGPRLALVRHNEPQSVFPMKTGPQTAPHSRNPLLAAAPWEMASGQPKPGQLLLLLLLGKEPVLQEEHYADIKSLKIK